jgi:hypothetical protein
LETEEKTDADYLGDNEWGITVVENVDESNSKYKVVESNSVSFSLDELKNQLGSLYKK